jgi:hypothetical protein
VGVGESMGMGFGVWMWAWVWVRERGRGKSERLPLLPPFHSFSSPPSSSLLFILLHLSPIRIPSPLSLTLFCVVSLPLSPLALSLYHCLLLSLPPFLHPTPHTPVCLR